MSIIYFAIKNLISGYRITVLADKKLYSLHPHLFVNQWTEIILMIHINCFKYA